MKSNKKRIVNDMILNIIAASVPLFVLQFIVYPFSAEKLGGDTYGLMVTIYSVWVMISNSLGTVLNNIKLLHYQEYENKKLEGDFPIFLRKWSVIDALVIGIIMVCYYREFNFLHLIIGMIIATLVLAKAYLDVTFRINLNFKAIVINNALQSIGFLLGCLVLYFTDMWEFIFLFGYLFSCIYCVMKTNLLKEKCKKTILYGKMQKECHELVIASIIGSLTTYADKLVLYPLMGGYMVSIYYTATILGKVIGMLTGPISGVVLSYIVKWDDSKKGVFGKVLVVGMIASAVGYFITLLLSRPAIGFLFPKWVDEVMVYLPITTITVSLMALISILQPFVLRFCDMKWQIVINAVGACIYFATALVLWKIFGLMGFCVGTVIGTLSKLIIMIVAYNSNRVRH